MHLLHVPPSLDAHMLCIGWQTSKVTRSVSSDFREGPIQRVLWLACKVSNGLVQRRLLIITSGSVPFEYKMYSQDDKEGWDESDEFKKAFSIDVRVEFVGVW